jgi:NADH-quinone oxidoreductase subunit G
VPRPEQHLVSFTIDGLEVTAPENVMLVDGAKHGDVEIPVFCYEPKLGQPVGACRMCLVEIEGIPKLQTACSTAVKDGMVVNTSTDRVREAQQAVVEFLLVNHPLDCPVCDKGGECPLQDITFGWGLGTSRFIEPKRHFKKPLALSPLIAIDRERCILCYRCVRFSQEISEDYQLVLLERGADSFVGTFDGHPYVAPFSGNITELCPVGALTNTAYRFRARPWDIENAGSVCTLCPAQCNVTFTVRDDRVMRVLARDNAEVDDGWLCDKGRYAFQSMHVDERITAPMVREGGTLRETTWERALQDAAAGLSRAGGRVGALAGGGASNEEGLLLSRLLREGLGSTHLDARADTALPLELERALGAPSLQARVSDLEFADAVLVIDCEPVDDAPILDLRLRKGVRRHTTPLAVVSSRPSSLDPNARLSLRVPPGAGEAVLGALDAALAGAGDLERLAAAAGLEAGAIRELAELLAGGPVGRGPQAAGASDTAATSGGAGAGAPGSAIAERAGREVVVLYGERLLAGPRGAHTARALLNVAGRLGLATAPGGGLLAVPEAANGRGLREAGVLPTAGPGLADPPAQGRGARDIALGLAEGDLAALYLLDVDPLRTHPDRGLWEAALERATTVVAHAEQMTEVVQRFATVVFPAEAYAEKEGTLVHPDGRVQRLRQAIGRPPEVRAGWQVIADVARAVGLDLGVLTSSMASAQLFEAVPFYAGLTLEELGGRGERWPEREQAATAPEGAPGRFELEAAPSPAEANGALRIGRYRSIWAAPEVEVSPALKFLAARQLVELSPGDAERRGIANGDEVEVAANGHVVRGVAALRARAPESTVFVADGIEHDGGNLLDEPFAEVRLYAHREAPA